MILGYLAHFPEARFRKTIMVYEDVPEIISVSSSQEIFAVGDSGLLTFKLKDQGFDNKFRLDQTMNDITESFIYNVPCKISLKKNIAFSFLLIIYCYLFFSSNNLPIWYCTHCKP